MSSLKSFSLPAGINRKALLAAAAAQKSPLSGEVCSGSSSKADEAQADVTSPVGRLLFVLQALLQGTPVDMSAVRWLHNQIVCGDFTGTGGTPLDSRILRLKALEKDVGASLVLMLGPGRTRRGSKYSDDDSSFSWLAESMPSHRSSMDLSYQLERSSMMDELDSFPELEPAWPLTTTPVPEVEQVLRSASTWAFDAFRLAELTGGHSLSTLGFWLLNIMGVVQDQGLDVVKLANYLRAVDSRYPPAVRAPYHNGTHATDVLQQMHQLLTAGGLAQMSHRADPLTLLACYMAAIVHDVDHQAVNNDFLVRSGDRLALVYNDNSPQENHHAAVAFHLLRQPDCNFIRQMPKEKRVKLRQMVIAMVLATDMKMHVSLFAAFESKVDVLRYSMKRESSARPASDSGQGLSSKGGDICHRPTWFDSETEAGRTLVLQMALKCADLGHASAPWDLHVRWVSALEEELFLQGDKEQNAHLQVSPLMDRRYNGVSKSQVGFLDMVALPLFRAWGTAFPDARPVIRNAESNFDRWKVIKAAGGRLLRTPGVTGA